MALKKTIIAFSVLTLASCSYFDEKPVVKKAEKPTQKQQIESSIKDDEINITINEDISSGKKYVVDYISKLPEVTDNNSWFRNNYIPGENLKLNKTPSDYSTVSIGSKPKRGFEITSQPIVAEGKIFTLGGQGELSARSLNDKSKQVWSTMVEEQFLQEKRIDYDWLDDLEGALRIKDKDEFLGGNICYSRGTVFVTTKRGNVFAVNARNGKVIWSKSMKSPVRSSPAAKNNILVFTTVDSKTYALNAITGKIIWQHEASVEKTKFVTAPTPLIINDKVIIPYASGEVFALNLYDGEEIWLAITSPERITQLLPTNNDISVSPIYHQGFIFVVSSDGTVFALNEGSGEELWQFKGMAIAQAPWAVGNYLFAVSRFGEIFAISFKDGETIWRKDLADKDDIDDDNLIFGGPIMANGDIYVADNKGVLRSYSPKNGKIKKEIDVADNILQQGVVVNGKMFFISNNSSLVEIE